MSAFRKRRPTAIVALRTFTRRRVYWRPRGASTVGEVRARQERANDASPAAPALGNSPAWFSAAPILPARALVRFEVVGLGLVYPANRAVPKVGQDSVSSPWGRPYSIDPLQALSAIL